MKKEYTEFIKECGGLEFPNIFFHPGAREISDFGLINHYKMIDGVRVWGYPGIHFGIDLGNSHIIKDGYINHLYSPFMFEKSTMVYRYISMIELFHKFGFIMKLFHCNPKWVELELLQSGKEIKKGTKLGLIGNYNAPVNETLVHSEIVSIDGYCISDFLEYVLREKYGDTNFQITLNDVISVYRKCSRTLFWKEDQIKKDYEQLRLDNNIRLLNKFKIIYKDSTGIEKTYYSSKYLFGI